MENKRKLLWFSCGVTSAVACKLAIEQYGADNVDIYYMVIDSAHKDNERFIKDCEKWYNKEILKVRSKLYLDQFEVIEDTGYVNGANGARCTLELKKKVRFDLQQKLGFPEQVFGFEYSKKEINRAIRFAEQWVESKPRFLLIENKLSKEECAGIIINAGIRLPTMYLLGYNNNNCIGCVKGGKGYWNKIRVDFPEEFQKMAEAERGAGHSCIKENYKEKNVPLSDEEAHKISTECDKWKIKEVEGDMIVYNKQGEQVNMDKMVWLKKLASRPKFLDELNPTDGRKLKPVVPDCGSICEIKYADIEHKLTNEIYKNPEKIRELYK